MKFYPKLLLGGLVALLLISCQTTPQPKASGPIVMTPVADYRVVNGELISENPDQPVLPEHLEIWDWIRWVYPQEWINFIGSFGLDTDGEMGGFAYVDVDRLPDGTALSTWRLVIDPADMILDDATSESHFPRVLTHEISHIMALNESQFILDEISDSDQDQWMNHWDFSQGYRNVYGIAQKNSYMNRFVQEFWPAPQILNWPIPPMDKINPMELGSLIAKVKDEYPDSFVSTYAMMSVEEDFAESFSEYVFQEDVQGDSVMSRKIRFFGQFDELVLAREQIRLELGL